MSGLDPLARFRLDGKIAVLTGASSGLGRRFAHVLHGAGASVVLAARRLDRLEELLAELGGDRVAVVGCDVSMPEQLDGLVGTALDRFGSVDVLVNNAGITFVGPAQEEGPQHFEDVVRVDLLAPFNLTLKVAGVMMGQPAGGVVGIAASILGVVGVGQVPQAGYAAAKGGLVNLTRELAAQWARRGIRVNALAPGWFPSEMTTEMFEDERSMKWVAGRTPMGRGGREDELDGALLFLASDASSYVTGQVLAVDGGWTAV